ncbi:ADP-ribosyl-[dinitrogen reductase] hydrolase [Dysgonomonas sp. PFB1-18]|uniref:ADP-ribosylglycohydrolase family protein n=1 Tax=unclassified Dysgonomonas TaxID=2630389 RepID=UPI0024747DCC|nr:MULTISPECIES: ADP-ribosylglycohydrolase family protein [unclassified Dysgonomonas]MDH6308020.1 ADP-ribosyl-[dinitrogen reductase] hydrolase [Dysgonomonas sp. PF1-14]MDH6339559.1 ADP-ribosyl-[dinitrogen reductase] hydrolase [Dysgonomonas sp. PF1-16]MDH6381210.1 ADP-ribosyl-[dinitrogen reductase] hydrolase [Dysgonomonas sp. PFB1-18]MDH6398422.1 ADP-ribosyl-[dinitrogen reductase] hydrolase [Dysgonomonas sp. PF1-23]
MLGAIIGDIIGSRFEFNNTNRTDFDLFTEESTYTDDTICTIAIADAILNGKKYKNSLLEWCRKYPNPKGAYGGSFARWIQSDDPQPYNSYGNGSAMRVSPVGWLFDSHQKVLSQAQLSAIPSHDHMGGIFGAQCVAALIFKLRTGEIDKGGIEQYISGYGYHVNSVNSIRMHNTFNETCHVTVPQAISCFLEANDFEETIRLAVSIGGDSDTIAAIAGSIAESYYKIPDHIAVLAIDKLPDDMFMIFTQFIKENPIYGDRLLKL